MFPSHDQRGHTKETIDALSQDELPEDFKVDEVISTVETSNKERYFKLFENDDSDESFKVKVIKENDGKWNDILERAFKKTGVDTEGFADMKLNDKMKKVGEFLKAEAEKKYQETGNKASEEIEKLQAELLEAKNKVVEIEEETEKKIQEANQSADSRVFNYKRDSELKGLYADIPSERLVTKKHTDGVYEALFNRLQNKYDTKYVDDSLTFFNKGTEQRVTGKDADGREAILPNSEIIKSELEDLGFWVKSNGQGDNGNPDGGTAEPAGKPVKSSMMGREDKIKANMAKFQDAVKA